MQEKKEALCFIEVKSRKSTRFGLPEEYVDARKQKKLLKTAMSYLRKNENPDIDMRFDVISVDLKKIPAVILKMPLMHKGKH